MDIDYTSYRSLNFSERKEKIRFIILHYTSETFIESLKKLSDSNPLNKNKVSSHYLIKDTGEIYQLVDDDKSAWHAGISHWHEYSALNESSIGIEQENLGKGPYSITLLNSCIELCQRLMIKYSIPKQNVIAHSDIAPDRKLDPGIFFDWAYLAAHGIGVWHDIDTKYITPKILFHYGDFKPEILILQDNLKKIGYQISHTGKFDNETNFVVRAFQSKYNSGVIKKLGVDYYLNENSIYSWDETSNKILLNLLAKLKLAK